MSLGQCFGGRRDSKWPRSLTPGAQKIYSNTEHDDHDSIANFSRCVWSLREHEYKSDDGDQRGNRIKPHPKWSRKFRPATPQPEQPNRLDQELDHNSNYHQRGDYVGQSQAAEERCDTTKYQQGDMRDVVLRMNLPERTEVVSVARCCIRYARVTQQQREHGCKRSPHDQQRRELRRACSIQSLHEDGDRIVVRIGLRALLQLLPGQNAKHADVHHKVEHSHRNDGYEQSARNIPRRILDLSADEADVVIAPVIVVRDQHRSAKPEEESAIEGECIWREAERSRHREVSQSGEYDPRHRTDHSNPE